MSETRFLPTQIDNMRLLSEAYASKVFPVHLCSGSTAWDLDSGWESSATRVARPLADTYLYVIHCGKSFSCPLPAPNEGLETASSNTKPTDEEGESLGVETAVYDIAIKVSIQSHRQQYIPSTGALIKHPDSVGQSFQRPPPSAIFGPLICGRFINEDKVIRFIFAQPRAPICPCFIVPLFIRSLDPLAPQSRPDKQWGFDR
jgi:hypothetical protein